MRKKFTIPILLHMLALMLIIGCVSPNQPVIVNPPAIDPIEEKVSPLAGEFKAAFKVYISARAKSYRGMEANPSATVEDANARSKADGLMDKMHLDQAFTKIMARELGNNNQLDPANAKRVFGAVAEGLESIK